MSSSHGWTLKSVTAVDPASEARQLVRRWESQTDGATAVSTVCDPDSGRPIEMSHGDRDEHSEARQLVRRWEEHCGRV